MRSTASTAAAAKPKAVEKKLSVGGGLAMEKNDSRLVDWCSERWSSGSLVRQTGGAVQWTWARRGGDGGWKRNRRWMSLNDSRTTLMVVILGSHRPGDD